MSERTLFRIGAISAFLGVALFLIGMPFHGGEDPANLQDSLTQYGSNDNWIAVHILQFLGFLLIVYSLVALHRSITSEHGAAWAQLGYVSALVSIVVFAANQAVDGIAIKFVAVEWLNAPIAEKEVAFLVAAAVRNIEIGLSSFSVLMMSITIFFFGLAVAFSKLYPKFLGWVAVPIGIAGFVGGLSMAYTGFAATDLVGLINIAIIVWVMIMAVLMWRRADTSRTAKTNQ